MRSVEVSEREGGMLSKSIKVKTRSLAFYCFTFTFLFYLYFSKFRFDFNAVANSKIWNENTFLRVSQKIRKNQMKERQHSNS